MDILIDRVEWKTLQKKEVAIEALSLGHSAAQFGNLRMLVGVEEFKQWLQPLHNRQCFRTPYIFQSISLSHLLVTSFATDSEVSDCYYYCGYGNKHKGNLKTVSQLGNGSMAPYRNACTLHDTKSMLGKSDIAKVFPQPRTFFDIKSQ